MFNGAEWVKWPPYSADLNPIEYVWVWIKHWISKNYEIRLIGKTLIEAITRAWNAIPNDYLLKLMHSMPKRLSAVRAALGGYTTY